MAIHKRPILVFGATGQQGGSVVAALLQAGWQVRAFVRHPGSSRSVALRDAGAELMQGDLADIDSIRSAMKDIHGVFSVQPSSGQGAMYGLSDEDEIRHGITVADVAVESGARHLVHSSSNAVGGEPTGMGHFDSKARIEAHVRTLPIVTSIIRPAAFMEMLVMPGFGLDKGRFNFFMTLDQPMQFVAIADIGRIVAAIFADPARVGGSVLEIASDVVTGRHLEDLFTQAAGRPISYSRFPAEMLVANPFLAKLADLIDQGRLEGHADFEDLRRLNLDLVSFQSWFTERGRDAFEAALGAASAWPYGPAA